jgi:hypothetical protein
MLREHINRLTIANRRLTEEIRKLGFGLKESKLHERGECTNKSQILIDICNNEKG